ncbi:MAG: hypothetical protein ACKOPO_10245, partial [Novosphingobium sp.]
MRHRPGRSPAARRRAGRRGAARFRPWAGRKDALQDLIATEDPARPYSDAELAQLLDKQGMPLARRTVAKYRKSLDILA